MMDKEITKEEALQAIAELSEEDKWHLVYETIKHNTFTDIKKWSLWLLDLIDSHNIVNNYKEGRSDLIPVHGMLLMLSQLVENAYSDQARIEMQVVNEASVYGMETAEELAVRATNLRTDIASLIDLALDYESILQGRRMDKHFVNEEGDVYTGLIKPEDEAPK